MSSSDYSSTVLKGIIKVVKLNKLSTKTFGNVNI